MIEWLLTDNHSKIYFVIAAFVSATSLAFSFMLAMSMIGSDLKDSVRRTISILLLALSIVIIGLTIYVDSSAQDEVVTEGDWVQIYSNDQKADISIYFSPTSVIRAGEEISSSHLNKLKTLYSRNEVEDVTVVASKDGAEERRVVNLDGRNISIPLDKDYSMKITKIEYQKIVGQRKTLFGHTGSVSKSYLDGQIKITVDGEKSSNELKELFDGKKQ